MVTVLKRMSRPIFVSIMLWGPVVANACALAKMAGRQFLPGLLMLQVVLCLLRGSFPSNDT